MKRRNSRSFTKSLTAHTCQFEVISIGFTAAKHIAEHCKIGQVHSVFRRVVNVLVPDGRLISVVCKDIGNGPFNIVVNAPPYMSMKHIGVKRNHEVLRVDDSIVIGDNVLMISTKHAEWLRPLNGLRVNPLNIGNVMQNLRIIREVVGSCGDFRGLGQLIELTDEHRAIHSERELNLYSRLAKPHIEHLLEAIRTNDYEAIRRNSTQLIGFGPGLTPSGDDMLLGLTACLGLLPENLNINVIQVPEVNMAIASCVPGKTTLISQEMLLHAAAGQVGVPIAELIEMMLLGSPDEISRATRHLLSFGGSSGTDIVLGILLGSQLLLNEACISYDKERL
ncbi:MAG: DUF2877 domain-containing protein [Candidatus Thorarchaeota archaeon]